MFRRSRLIIIGAVAVCGVAFAQSYTEFIDARVFGTLDVQGALEDQGGNLMISDSVDVTGTVTSTANPGVVVSTTQPVVRLTETDAAADNQRWVFAPNTEQFRIGAQNDAGSVTTSAITIDRTGTTIDSIGLNATNVTINGSEVCRTSGAGCPGGIAGLANPTATIGLTAVNGAATTALRSDGAPALSQAITPNWSGAHRFSSTGGSPGSYAWQIENSRPRMLLYETDAAVDNAKWLWDVNSEQLVWQLVNDSVGAGTGFFTVNRTGNTVDSVAIAGTSITLNGVASSDFARLSAANVFTEPQRLSDNSITRMLWNTTDGGADEKLWEFRSDNADQFLGLTRTDADGAGASWLQVVRSGTSISTVALQGTSVTVNGQSVCTGNGTGCQAPLSGTNTWTGVNTFTNTSGAGGIRMQSADTSLGWIETDAAADNGKWRIRAQNENLNFETSDDAISTGTNFFQVTRTGISVDALAFNGGSMTFNGVSLRDAAIINSGTLAVARGGTNLTSASDDNTMVGNGTTWQSKALTSCSGTSSAVTYDTSTNTFGCNTLLAGSNTQLQFNNSGSFGADAAMTFATTTNNKTFTLGDGVTASQQAQIIVKEGNAGQTLEMRKFAGVGAEIRTTNSTWLDLVVDGNVIAELNTNGIDLLGNSYGSIARPKFFAGTSDPSTLAATVNDWNISPRGTVFATPASGGTTITGIIAGARSQMIIINNVSTTDFITLANESASSSANNRLSLPNSMSKVIPPLSGLTVIYNNGTSRWRIVGGDDVISGSYTGTVTGCTTSPTVNVRYIKTGMHVAIQFDTAVQCTSNATTFTITGAPEIIQPTTAQTGGYICCLRDSTGDNLHGWAHMNNAGTIAFSLLVSGGGSHLQNGAFTNSGTKGISATPSPATVGGWSYDIMD